MQPWRRENKGSIVSDGIDKTPLSATPVSGDRQTLCSALVQLVPGYQSNVNPLLATLGARASEGAARG